MRKRTMAREAALKILYASDINRESITECAGKFWDNEAKEDDEVRSFSEYLIRGVSDHAEQIDRTITKYAANWELERMATVDRNVLRIACFELLFSEDIPPKVAINEAIDIAKKYGDKDSGKFVNGILDKINKTEQRQGSIAAD
ncbi:MAG: transcription antitermination factor NusB [Candidatus Omnitrophica bacterium]|nr:transcription antitermination factor NusB [Candidatus Omnitrophota bacterium]